MKKNKQTMYRGSCLCGEIKFSFVAPLDDVWFCHCQNCRKNYGMYGAFAGVSKKLLHINNPKSLTHYKSAAGSIRSFCKKCGSPITWNIENQSNIYILLGLLNGKIKIKKANHIWMSDKGGYYQVHDGYPKYKIYP